MNKNPREGGTLRSLFEELGEWDEVEARVEKRVIAETLRREMTKQNVTKSELAKRMDTSRSQVDAILNGEDAGLTLLSLSRCHPDEDPPGAGSASPLSSIRRVRSICGLDFSAREPACRGETGGVCQSGQRRSGEFDPAEVVTETRDR
jgi:antitoxin HicB